MAARQHHQPSIADPKTCAQPDLATRTTKSLLGYGVISAPIYLAVWLIQAATRTGFDLRRHPASILENGRLGWIQTANFVLAGAMVLAGAGGLRRAQRAERSGLWTARLIALFGVGMVGAGIFRADPAYGFPPGTATGKAVAVTWHGNLHLLLGSAGFLALIVATFVEASRFARRGDRRRAALSAAAGLVFLVATLSGTVLAAHHEVAYNVTLTAGILVGFAWLSAFCVHSYRQVSSHPPVLQPAGI
jgi:Protein of unknown function (DUF998)